jgi:peptidylprolyl isomerase
VAGKDRKRQIARERYEKRMAARAQARAKARQRTAIGLAAGGVIAIVGIVLLFTLPSKKKSAASLSSPESTPSAAPSSPLPAVPTTAAGCTTKPSVVATPVANFPILPAGVDAQLKSEPTITIPSGPVPTKVQVKDLVVGQGATVGPTDSVTINYLGFNYVDCSEFDSSWAASTEATFSLQGVIPGFTKGIGGDTASGIAPMKVGGRREIIVPPADGYGTTGQGKVGPNEELVFVVDVLAASTPSASPSAPGSGSPSASPSASASVSPSASASVSSSTSPSAAATS